MTWDVGDLVPLTTTVKVGGVLTNATMLLTVTDPAAVVTTPAVTNTGTGTYTASVLATLAGDYLYVWTASGAATAVQPGQFSVDPLTLRLLSLDDAKGHLNVTTTTHDEELRSMVDGITSMVEDVVGAVIPRTVTEYVETHGNCIRLTTLPVLSITTVTPATTNLSAPAAADLTVEKRSGIVYYTAGGSLPPGRMLVTYRAGRQPIPAGIRMAAKIILAHNWESQRGGSAGPRAGGFEEGPPVPGMGFAMPHQATGWLSAFVDDAAPVVA